MRHITLVMLAHAFSTAICVQDRAWAGPPPGVQPPEAETSWQGRPLLALTVPEGRHLLGQLIWPAPCSVKGVLAWSWWRRCHRSGASYFHTKRRLEAG